MNYEKLAREHTTIIKSYLIDAFEMKACRRTYYSFCRILKLQNMERTRKKTLNRSERENRNISIVFNKI